jgi:enolase-phosphatase E1
MTTFPSSRFRNIVLDIEGTICPISFVKDELFPYFLTQLPDYLSRYTFPLDPNNDNNDEIENILTQFDESLYQSKDLLLKHLQQLVADDIKDSTLKQLQGFIWENGYTTGSIMAPLYKDAIESIKLWSALCDGVYIYSSGSVKAQKLLLGNVKIENENKSIECADMTGLIDDYFDTVNIGKKTETSSYTKILAKIGIAENDKEAAKECLFLSDNPLEVEAALASGMSSYIVVKPGNYPLSEREKSTYEQIDDLRKLFD